MSRSRWATRITAGALLACALFANAAGAQAPAAQQPPPSMVAAVLSAEPSGEPFTLTYFNRPIVVLRARVLGAAAGRAGRDRRSECSTIWWQRGRPTRSNPVRSKAAAR